MLVSRESGLRSSGQLPSLSTSAPVRMNPPSPRASSAGSQSVFGWAPIIRKSSSAANRLRRAVGAGPENQALQPAVLALASADDLGPEAHVYVGRAFDLPHQVVRHPLVERLGSHHERHPPGVFGEVERRLAGGIRAADDVRLLIHRRRRLGDGAAVEDPRPDQGLELGDAEPAVGGARREDDRAGADLAAVGEADVEAVAVAPDPGRVVHEGELGAEDPRLLVGALRQPPTADAARKAEVVADQRARGRLPADPAARRRPASGSPPRRRRPPPRGRPARRRR